jgi:hypothetical protein
MRALSGLVLGLLLAVAAPAAAQTTSTPDGVLEDALSHWRAASWYVHLGDDNVTAIEIDSLRLAWQNVAALPADQRPSLYAKDPRWPATVAAISKLADDAADAVDTGDKAEADKDLTRIGDDLADSRRRAGTAGFSDAVRRYRDAVMRLSSLIDFQEQRRGTPFDDAKRAEVRQAAADCSAAATALDTSVPVRWASDQKLKQLIRQNRDSVASVTSALDQRASGLDVAAAVNVLRSNYYLLFLNYG